MELEFEWTPSEARHRRRHPPGRRLLTLSTEAAAAHSISASPSTAITPAVPPALPPPSAEGLAASRDPPGPARSSPVPLLTVGAVFVPIAAGSRATAPEMLEAVRQLGLGPMLSAAMGASGDPEHYIDVASLTDPLMASNLLQGVADRKRKVLFVEKGAAEQLATGKSELEVLSPRVKDTYGFWYAMRSPWHAWKRFSMLTKQKADALAVGGPRHYKLRGAKKKSGVGGGAGERDEGSRASISSSNVGNPALVHVPVRMALNLLRGLPGRFLLLAEEQEPAKRSFLSGFRQRWGNLLSPMNVDAAKKRNKKNEGGTGIYEGADKLRDLQVHYLPGTSAYLHGSGRGTFHLMPVFLSKFELQRCFKLTTAAIAKGALLYRALERKAWIQQARAATAFVAAGGGGASGIVSQGGGEDDDDASGGFGDIPEVQQAVGELGGRMNGGLREPAAGAVRAAATLATGMITLLAPVVEIIGAAVDVILYMLPKGDVLLGVPSQPLNIQSAPLSSVLTVAADFNASQAAAAPGGHQAHADSIALRALMLSFVAQMAGDEAVERLVALVGKMLTGSHLTPGDTLQRALGHSTLAAALSAYLDSTEDPMPGAPAVAVARCLLPALEHNAFRQAFPTDDSAAKEAVGKLLSPADGRLVLTARLGQLWVSSATNFKEGVGCYMWQGGEAAGMEAVDGMAVMVVGDTGDKLRRNTGAWPVLGHSGRGVSVGVEDARKYLSSSGASTGIAAAAAGEEKPSGP